MIELSRRTKIIFTGALLGLVLSKGLAVMPGFSVDDYRALNESRAYAHFISQGRYSVAAIQFLLDDLGVSAPSLTWVGIIMSIVAAACAITMGILFSTREQGPVMPQAAIAAILGSHPYLTEYFSFREASVFVAISFALLALSFGIILNGEKHAGRYSFWLTVTLLFLTGITQTIFLIAFFFVLTRFTIDSVTAGGLYGIKQSWRSHSRLFATFVFAGIVYAVVFIIIQKYFGGSNDGRASLIAFSDLPQRFDDIEALLINVYLTSDPIMSQSVKLLTLLTIVGSTLMISIYRPSAAIGIILLFIALISGSIFLVSVSAIWWPAPRSIYGIGFSYGLILLVTIMLLNKGHRIFLGVVCTIALGMIFHSNAMLYDQMRLNRWDLWTAGAIAQDLADKGVKPEQKILLVGTWGYEYPAGPRTIVGDFNISALSTAVTKYLMKESTGRDWNIESVEGTLSVCPVDKFWPSPDSIIFRPQDVVVCMASP